jgi:hypothetical protein
VLAFAAFTLTGIITHAVTLALLRRLAVPPPSRVE